MKRRLLYPLLLITLLISIPGKSQISYGGIPRSFNADKSAVSSEVPFIILPAINIEKLKSEDVYNDELKDHPWRFGKNIFVDYNPENSGTWTDLPDGGRLWRLGITSVGALSINLAFNKYRLPEGAELFIYNSDKTVILGKFNHNNNKEHGKLATALIPGESIIIEYYETQNAAFNGELNLWRITHGYRSVTDFQKSLGSSGNCNVNAICTEGDPIRDQIRSAAMLVVDGEGFCSGAMIGNTRGDNTPYFLSAYHCSKEYDSEVDIDPSTLVFWFNWQSTTCSNPFSSPSYNSISGAITRARYSISDFWLLELSETPPDYFNVFYSGWNRAVRTEITGKCWGIHHPNGDIKKISWTNNGVSTSGYLNENGVGFNHWYVESWSDGTTTEGGSSGSPLYDTDLRIIGQLHGGHAACGNTDSDWYGKLSASWTGGGNNFNRLSNWLDPSGTNAEYINGYPAVIDGSISELLMELNTQLEDTALVKPIAYLTNLGDMTIQSAQIEYTITGFSPQSTSWTGNLEKNESVKIEFPIIELEHGEYTVNCTLNVTNDEITSNNTSENTIYIDSSYTPQLLSASITNVRDVDLTWTSDGSALFYDGFESGNFAQWAEVTEGSGTLGDPSNNYPYWYILNNSTFSYSGNYAAAVDWGYTLDTRLKSDPIAIESASSLKFYWVSNYTYHVDPNDNGDLFVEVSTDNGSSWTSLWTFGNIGVWEDDVWYETIIDLGAYSGQDLTISFHVVASDNDNITLDDVMIYNNFNKRSAGTRPVSINQNIPAEKGTRTYNKALKQYQSYYSVLRNGIEIAQVVDTTYTDSQLSGGNYYYQIIAHYSDPVTSSTVSNELEVEIPPLSINQNEIDDNSGEITVFPNPSDGLIYFTPGNAYFVNVLNTNGMVLKSIQIDRNTSTLNLGNLKNGLYILHFTGKNKTFVKRIIIQ